MVSPSTPTRSETSVGARVRTPEDEASCTQGTHPTHPSPRRLLSTQRRERGYDKQRTGHYIRLGFILLQGGNSFGYGDRRAQKEEPFSGAPYGRYVLPVRKVASFPAAVVGL